MQRFIVIDNASGYICGEANAADIIEAARAVDAETGSGERDMKEVGGFSFANDDGYLVYEASADFPAIDDGQDQDMINRVTTECRFAGCVAIVKA